MSLRDVLLSLSGTAVPLAHPGEGTENLHIFHGSTHGSLGSLIHKGAKRQLDEELSNICEGIPLTVSELRNELSPEDVEYWLQGEVSAANMSAFARSLVQRREMEKGLVPAHYTERASCAQCGEVWLWFSGEVLGCPWCWNRIRGRPIPRPSISSEK